MKFPSTFKTKTKCYLRIFQSIVFISHSFSGNNKINMNNEGTEQRKWSLLNKTLKTQLKSIQNSLLRFLTLSVSFIISAAWSINFRPFFTYTAVLLLARSALFPKNYGGIFQLGDQIRFANNNILRLVIDWCKGDITETNCFSIEIDRCAGIVGWGGVLCRFIKMKGKSNKKLFWLICTRNCVLTLIDRCVGIRLLTWDTRLDTRQLVLFRNGVKTEWE